MVGQLQQLRWRRILEAAMRTKNLTWRHALNPSTTNLRVINVLLSRALNISTPTKYTTSCAIADEPRDAMCQSKFANYCITLVRHVQKIEVIELEGYSRPTYNKIVHSATTRATVVGVIHKLTVESTSLLITPIHRRLAVAKFLTSKKITHVTWPCLFRGQSVTTRLMLHMANPCTKFEVCSLVVPGIFHGV